MDKTSDHSLSSRKSVHYDLFSPHTKLNKWSLTVPRLFAIQFNAIVIFCQHHKKIQRDNLHTAKGNFFQFHNTKDLSTAKYHRLTMTILTKRYRLQEQPKPFVLVHLSAWASLENNVNKRTSAAPVIYTFWSQQPLSCMKWPTAHQTCQYIRPRLTNTTYSSDDLSGPWGVMAASVAPVC